MDIGQVKGMGKELKKFLGNFADCFGRYTTRENLKIYIEGQLSDLPRKSIEPIALAADMEPRTLQHFLSKAPWDEIRLRDHMQEMVAEEHAHPQAIGIIDDSGNPKKGQKTAAVQRQWCGNTGKIDNCVVGVHLGYVVKDFQCLLDSELYLPRAWAEDPERRKEAGIPDEAEYRKKTTIALGQVARALDHGIRVAAWNFDEWYGRDGEFLDGLEGLQQKYLGEIPANFTGWLSLPSAGRDASEVQNLLSYSRNFQQQEWQRFRIKDGEKGPQVWEVKAATFYRKPDQIPHTLIVARDVVSSQKVKYFLSDMVPGEAGVTLDWLLWVAFSRWPIERCFELGKRDLGMDHFEVRTWTAIHRHWYISQLSQLFCARLRRCWGETKRPGTLYLTVEQIREAASTWVAIRMLPYSARQILYQRVAKKISYYQRRNLQARKSHTKTTLRRLRKLGIKVSRLKSCVPSE